MTEKTELKSVPAWLKSCSKMLFVWGCIAFPYWIVATVVNYVSEDQHYYMASSAAIFMYCSWCFWAAVRFTVKLGYESVDEKHGKLRPKHMAILTAMVPIYMAVTPAIGLAAITITDSANEELYKSLSLSCYLTSLFAILILSTMVAIIIFTPTQSDLVEGESHGRKD